MKKILFGAMALLTLAFTACENEGQTVAQDTTAETAKESAVFWVDILGVVYQEAGEIDRKPIIKCHTPWANPTGQFVVITDSGESWVIMWNDNSPTFPVAGGHLYSAPYNGHPRYYSSFHSVGDCN